MARDHDVAGRHLVGPAGADLVEDVFGRLRRIHLHREGRVHRVGVEVVAEHPHLARHSETHAVTLLASVMYPVIADAATVAGEAMKISASGLPIRPVKLRVLDVMHTSPGADHAHVVAEARTAGRVGDDAARVRDVLQVAQAHRLAVHRLGCGRDEQAHAGRDGLATQHVCRDLQVLELPVGARTDERLIDLLPAEPGHRQPVATDGARFGDVGLETGQVDVSDVVVGRVGIR